MSGVIASDSSQKKAQAQVYALTLGMGQEGSHGFVRMVESISADIGEAAIAFNAIYNQGKQGKALSAAKNMELLSPEQRQYAYNLGIMDRALGSARMESEGGYPPASDVQNSSSLTQRDGTPAVADAELSGENSGKVLQKDGGSGTIKENEQGDINNEQRKAERSKAQFASDRGAESRTFESTSGTRAENENRSRIQSEDGKISPDTGGTFTSNRGINGITTDSDISFSTSDIVRIDKNHSLYETRQRLIDEYGIECYIIKTGAWNRKAPAAAYKGKIYMSEDFSGNLLITVIPHETTHAMKQLKYQPYLDFIDKVPDMLDRSSPNMNILIDWIAEHCGFDFFSMSMSEAMHFYDEMNAAIYGFYKSDMFESEGLADTVPNAFYDFDSYIAELDAIHEQFKKDVQARKVESYKQIDNADPDVQQAKENAIEPERMVYSSEKAMAYDAVAEDKLSADQKKAVNVGKDIGRKVVICDTRTADGVPVDGFLGNDGVIYISKNNKSPMAFLFKHELAHFCERAGQKYQDFIDAVRKSAAFKNWLKQKGMSELEYNRQIRNERAAIGQNLSERGATMEIMANFVGDMMFGDNTTLADNLIGELKPKQKRSVREFLRDFFDWIKGRFTGKGNTARTEIHRLEKMFGEAFRTAVKVEQGSGEQFAYVKKGSYIRKTSYYYNSIPFINKHFPPENEVLSEAHRLAIWWAKRPDIISGDQTIISMNNKYYVVEKFDTGYYRVVSGIYAQDVKKIEKEIKNRGNVGRIKSIQRVDAGYDLRNSSDLSNEKGGSSANSSVVGHRRKDTQVENLASSSHSGRERTGRDGSGNNQGGGADWQGQDVGTEQFSYSPQSDKVEDVFERLRNGEISLDEAEKLLKKPEADNPTKIASIKKEDMNTNVKIILKPLAKHRKIWYNNKVNIYLSEKYYEKLYGQGFFA